MSQLTNPHCREANHRACSGDGWDEAANETVPCWCDCHDHHHDDHVHVAPSTMDLLWGVGRLPDLTLPVIWNQKRLQYEAYCHECKALAHAWSAEWVYRSNMRAPKEHQHACRSVKLIDLGPNNPHPDFYEPAPKENKTS